jgi:group I intron endonuclease
MARKEKKYHYIYKTTNLLSGKYYLGMHSTNNLEDGYMGSGRRLRRSINKYGKDNHKVEILEFVDTRDKLKEREEEIVNLNEIAKEDCMNLVVGGGGGFTVEIQSMGGKTTSEKYKDEQVNWGKKGGKNNIKKNGYQILLDNRKDWTGRKHSEETKKLMSEASKGQGSGKANSQYGTCWITNGVEAKKIKKEELNTYISQGWEKGRKKRKMDK